MHHKGKTNGVEMKQKSTNGPILSTNGHCGLPPPVLWSGAFSSALLNAPVYKESGMTEEECPPLCHAECNEASPTSTEIAGGPSLRSGGQNDNILFILRHSPFSLIRPSRPRIHVELKPCDTSNKG